jgi:hypothetical protein
MRFHVLVGHSVIGIIELPPAFFKVCSKLFLKLRIPELKRLFALPDDFIVTGRLRQATERICRMVPPFQTKAMVMSVYEKVLKPCVPSLRFSTPSESDMITFGLPNRFILVSFCSSPRFSEIRSAELLVDLLEGIHSLCEFQLERRLPGMLRSLLFKEERVSGSQVFRKLLSQDYQSPGVQVLSAVGLQVMAHVQGGQHED